MTFGKYPAQHELEVCPSARVVIHIKTRMLLHRFCCTIIVILNSEQNAVQYSTQDKTTIVKAIRYRQ